MKSLYKTILFAFLISIFSQSQAQVYSELWGVSGEKFIPAGRLPDFSFAGYKTGTEPIPNFPVKATLGENGALPNDGVDDATELQGLIDNLVTPGTIIIPAGKWDIGKRITITKSGVVIKGAAGAEFYMPNPLKTIDEANGVSTLKYDFNQAFFNLRGSIMESANASVSVVANAAQGVKLLKLSSTANIAIGDWVKITQVDDATESMYQYINNVETTRSFYQNPPTDNILLDPKFFTFYTKVTDINGDFIAIDRHLPIKMETKWTPKVVVLDMDGTTQNIGIENITFRMNGEQWGGHFKNVGSSAIGMSGLMNCWIKDVNIIDSDLGINCGNIAFCTITGVNFPIGLRTGSEVGHHAIWFVSSSRDNLITDFKLDVHYLHDLSVESHSTQNVFSNSSGIKINFDHHRGAPFANLFTNINVGNANGYLASSGSFFRGPHTGIYTTLWNLQRTSGGFGTLPSSSNSAQNTPGGSPAPDWFFMNAIGLNGVSRANDRNHYVEFTSGENLGTPNLHEAQFARRLSAPPVDPIDPATLPTDSTYDTPQFFSNTVPPNQKSLTIELWGGGGSGGGSNLSDATRPNEECGGGGGGGYSKITISVTPGDVYIGSVGGGGASRVRGDGNSGSESAVTGPNLPSSFNAGGGKGGKAGPSGDGGAGGDGTIAGNDGGKGNQILKTSGAGGKGANGGDGGAAIVNDGLNNQVGESGTAPGGGGSGAIANLANSGNKFAKAGGAGASGKAIFTYFEASLPVSLISFDASAVSNGAKLTWQTASEANNNRFEILRSTDNKTYVNVATVEGKGTTSANSSYSVYDANPENGVNYYKLVQIDNDGTTKELAIKSVRFSLEKASALSVYPNPANGILNLVYNNSGTATTAKLNLVGISGNVVLTKQLRLEKGVNSFKIDVSTVKVASYIVSVSTGNGQESIKVLIN